MNYQGQCGGSRFIETLDMVDYVEDWSDVRSPSRAARRRRRGHPQRIVTRAVPKKEALTMDDGRTFFIHPAAAQALRAALPLGKGKIDGKNPPQENQQVTR